MIYPEKIGKRIYTLRKQHHETQEDLAAETGMYQEDISKLETGKKDSGIADLYKLDAIATHYGISLAEIILEKLKAACASEEAYKIWKKDLINAKTQYLLEKGGLVACRYMFAGMGSYREILPEEEVEGFKNWVWHNGAGFFLGTEASTKAEIKNCVAKHIADDLLIKKMNEQMEEYLQNEEIKEIMETLRNTGLSDVEINAVI